jgi:mono/diheme cytochrome c family protein
VKETSRQRGKSGMIVIGIMAVVIVSAVAVLIVFANQEREQRGAAAASAETLSAETYMDVVEPLLANANPENGPALLQRHGCNGCHMGSAVANNLAPSFVGMREQLPERRPPLQPEAYLYEAIVYPNAHQVEGYVAQMPVTYGDMPDQELGDMMAYLLTADIQP